MDDAAKTGVSLAALRELAGRVAAPDGVSTAAVVESVIRPATSSQACSYVELLPETDRGVPTLVVIAPWTLNFNTLIDALAQACPADSQGTSYIWLDVMACNLHDAVKDDRLDCVSHAATATSSSSPSQADTDAAPLTGPPTSALEPYRRAILAVTSSATIAPYGAAPRQADGEESGAAAPVPAPEGAVALVLDADAAVLNSPWCLYGIWSYMHHRRTAVASGQLGALRPLCAGGALDVLLAQLAWDNLSLLLPSPHTNDELHALILEEVAAEEPIRLPPAAAASAEAPLAAAARRPAASAAQPPLTPLPGGVQENVAGGSGGSGGSGGEGGDAAAGDVGGSARGEEQEVDIVARIAVADAAIKFGLLWAFKERVQSLMAGQAADVAAAPTLTLSEPTNAEAATARVAAAAAPAAPGEDAAVPEALTEPAPPVEPADTAAGAAEASVAAAEPTDAATGGSAAAASPAKPPAERLLALAVAADAYGCLLWAAGRPAEGEAHIRAARQVHAGLPHPHPQPLLPLASLLHHGALLLHVLTAPSSGGDHEAELLLRGAIVRLDAAVTAAGVAVATAAASSDGEASGGGAPATPAALLAAQARHFLARLLCLRVAAASGGAGSALPRGASGAHHLRDASENEAEPAMAAVLPPRPAAAAASAAAAAAVLCGTVSMHLPQGCAPAEAALLLRAALPAFEVQYGSEHPLTATLLSDLALVLKDQGKLDEAEPLLRRAVAARESCHGPSHLDTLRCMNNLAGLLEAQGQLEEAESLLRRAAELAAASLGPAHVYTASALSNLGVALRKAGKLDEAEELFKAALEIRERLLGPLALDTAASLADMTLLLLELGRPREAEPLFRRILDIRELVLGPGHPQTAASLVDLAALLASGDRALEAEPLLRRALSVQVRCLGPGHEDTASVTRELGRVLAQQGQTAEAEKHFRRALAVMEAVLGPNHPETVITVNQLAVLLKESGRGPEAEALFQRVLALTDPLDLDTAGAAGPAACALRRRLRAASMIAMRGLAEIACAAGRLEEAEVLSCRALVACERALGAVHPVTLACAEALAEVLRQLDLLEDAGELYARLVETLAEEYGEESELVVKYLALYEEVYAETLDREQRQRREQELEEPDIDGDGEEDADGDDGDDEDGAAEAESAFTTTSPAGGGKHVRISAAASARGRGRSGGGAVLRSGESVASVMSTLLGPLGRSLTAKRGAMHGGGGGSSSAILRQQARGSRASGGADNGDDDAPPAAGPRHSFASFVNRRGQQQQQPASHGEGRRAASRAQSVVSRVHSSLVAAGRIASNGPLGGARKSRLAAAAAGNSADGASAATSVVTGAVDGDICDNNGEEDQTADDDVDGPSVSPGLPLRDREEEAAAGAATVSLDEPRPYGIDGGGGSGSAAAAAAGGPLKTRGSSSSGAQLPPTVEEVFDPMTLPLITASGFAHGSITAGGAGSRSIRPAPPPAPVVHGRRDPLDAIDGRRSVTNSMISIRGGISKKALLQQADIDLCDDEDEDDKGNGYGGNPGGAGKAGPGKSPPDGGRAARQGCGDGGGHAAAAGHGDDDDAFEETSLGCCGFGGGAKRRVRPAN